MTSNRPLARRSLVGIAALALLAVGCDDDPEVGTNDPTDDTDAPEEVEQDPRDPDLEDLDEARERWDDAGIDDYEMTYEHVCFCPDVEITVTVEDGEVVDSQVTSTSTSDIDTDARTVDDFFDAIERALDGDAAAVSADYDDETGQVLEYFIDFDEEMSDEEFGIEVQVLTPT